MANKRARIEIYNRGFISKSKKTGGNLIVTQWKIVIDIRPEESDLPLGRFQRKAIHLVQGNRSLSAEDIVNWIESLNAEFKVTNGLKISMTIKGVRSRCCANGGTFPRLCAC